MAGAKAGGAEYAELTWIEFDEKKLWMQNGRLSSWTNREVGVAVRLLVGGRWGFAAGTAPSKTALGGLVKAALTAAQGAPPPTLAVELSASLPSQGSWEGPCLIDPFMLADSQLAAVLAECDGEMNRPGISLRRGSIHFRRQQRQYLNSEGSANHQVFHITGGGLSALAIKGGEVQQRSWPTPAGSYGGVGFEYLESLALPRHAQRIAEEAVALTGAPRCPAGVLDIILADSLLAHQIHYTLGYILQREVPAPDYSPGQRLVFPQFQLFSDATLAGGAGSYGYDWEGVQGRRFPLFEEGRLLQYLSGRQSAADAGSSSSGNMRSGSWLAPPTPWMSNLVLQPGAVDLPQMTADIELGLLLDTPRSSISTSTRQRTFAAQAEQGWLIEKGRITTPVKTPFYRGSILAFWNGCDAVAPTTAQKTFGIMDRGVAVGHQVVPVRIRGVRVGDGR